MVKVLILLDKKVLPWVLVLSGKRKLFCEFHLLIEHSPARNIVIFVWL